jgi:hypothetical protein
MSELPLEQPTPLDVELQGSAGRFRVGSGAGKSLRVNYFLTNVGLALASGTNSKLLDELAPVREVFRVEDLNFDELMQRDIDDARVTADLVPYLLANQNEGLVKLFPPIIVMVLPVPPGSSRPDPLYPVVAEVVDQTGPHDRYTLRIGDVGSEILELEQFMVAGKLHDHDRVRLRLNTHGTRLVIVDGQHRAMALLAIYRNMLDQWSDAKRAPYKDYYAEWTPEIIGQFDLEEVQLPVMLCFVPELHVDCPHDFNLIRAARQVFLTLNKTARKVSDSRNRLLDDADLMAVFLRSALGKIKSREQPTTSQMRIWNVELDQASDRTRVQSPAALTGVNHIYYVIEHLMLSSDDIHGVRARSGRYASRTSLIDCLPRLNGRNLLGDEAAAAIRRDNFSSDEAELLTASFDERYGAYLIKMFDSFGPYAYHNVSVAEVEQELTERSDTRVHTLLFSGQGAWRVFKEHIRALSRRPDKAAVEEIRRKLEIVDNNAQKAVSAIDQKRSIAFIKEALGDLNGAESLLPHLSVLYQNFFTTVAMQAAIIGTFFGELEKAQRTPKVTIETSDEFEVYLSDINRFFRPANKGSLIRFLRVMVGEVSPTSDDDWRVLPAERLFRRVVFTGEMQPDQWPKIRYLLLEIWGPTSDLMASLVYDEVVRCRQQIVASVFERLRSQLASSKNVGVEELDDEDLGELANTTAGLLGSLIENLDSQWEYSQEEAVDWALNAREDEPAAELED